MSQVDDLRALAQHWKAIGDEYTFIRSDETAKQLAAAADTIERLAKMLCVVEWIDNDDGMAEFCPHCECIKAGGHAPDCPFIVNHIAELAGGGE